MVIPRRNGKSLMTVVKFLMETFGRKKATEIIAEVNKGMEKTIAEMDIGRDIADTDIEDMEVQ